MRIDLDIPASWRSSVRGATIVYQLEPGLTIAVPPLLPLPEDVDGWLRGVAASERPPGAVLACATRTSALGWPMWLTDAVADGPVPETRLHVALVMIEHGTVVTAYAFDGARLAARRDEILAVLGSARPVWASDPGASLTELLEA